MENSFRYLQLLKNMYPGFEKSTGYFVYTMSDEEKRRYESLSEEQFTAEMKEFNERTGFFSNWHEASNAWKIKANTYLTGKFGSDAKQDVFLFLSGMSADDCTILRLQADSKKLYKMFVNWRFSMWKRKANDLLINDFGPNANHGVFLSKLSLSEYNILGLEINDNLHTAFCEWSLSNKINK